MALIFSGVTHKAVTSPTYSLKTKVGKNQLLCSFINLYAAQESCIVNAFEKEAACAAAAAGSAKLL